MYNILLENSHKNLNCTNAKNNNRKRIENFAILFLEINNETTINGNQNGESSDLRDI